MTGKMNIKPRYVRCPRCLNVLPEPADVPVYKCGGCNATLQAKKRNKSTVDTASQNLNGDCSGKRKVEQVFGDQIQEAGSSSKQQILLNSTDESDQNNEHDDLHSSYKDHEAANKAKNGSINAPSSGKQKIKQLSDDHEASSSSNQQPLVNQMDEPRRNIHNDPRSSTELSGHEDPESSPEATGHNRIDHKQEQEQIQNRDQDQNHSSQEHEQPSDDNVTCSSLNQQLIVNSINDLDQTSDHYQPHNSSELSYHENAESSPEATVHNRIDDDNDYDDDLDQVFLSCRREVEFEESSSEFEEAFANSRIVRGSDVGSKSSFKSLIAEKLLDTRQKKPLFLDEDDVLSEDVSAGLHHRRRFDRISSIETTETARFGGKSYYEYEGSVSSFDGNNNQNPRKHRIGSIVDEHVDSGNGYRFNRRSQIHPATGRLCKHEHRSTDVRSLYGLNPKYRSHIISENTKLERIELLKKVRELQDQLDRTNISNPQTSRYGRRMAFSGETTAVNRRLDGSSCHHCCPQDRHFSAQLPRQAQHVCCNGPHYEPKTFYSPRVSGLSTPIHNHPESEFSTPDSGYGYRHRNDVTKPFHSPMKKRYVRPIASGSPWIACYRCSKLLELPQSFLVFNKRYHSLKCGACMKVLNFTLSNGTHISRYYEETIAAPPSSEVEDYNELKGSRVEPVSCSDCSFQKSYSTETDRNGSWEFKRFTMSRDPSGSTQPSSSKISGRRKMRSEIEIERRPNGSPLHRLMGYASPSKVIRG